MHKVIFNKAVADYRSIVRSIAENMGAASKIWVRSQKYGCEAKNIGSIEKNMGAKPKILVALIKISAALAKMRVRRQNYWQH
jgi:hypothetical protein